MFGLFRFRIAVFLDVFSRFPLALVVYLTEPSAADMVALLEKALAFGMPRVLVTDQRRIFRSELLASACLTLGIDHRFAVLYQHGSIVRLALFHCAFHRPHAALKGATPAEVFLRLRPAAERARHPPRGLPGEVVPFPEFLVEHLGPNLPIVRRKAA